MTNPIFHRLELLIGSQALARLQETKVILFGIGGVGSWCAESLIRSGVGQLTIVDSDRICTTNINRQLHSISHNVGQSKVKEQRDRLLAINPAAEITAVPQAYTWQNGDQFHLDAYDYVIDAIDSLSSKVDLVRRSLSVQTTLFSALGASCKLDPTRIKIGSFWEVRECRLARHMRKRLRKRKVTRDFLCVYSSERLPNALIDTPCGTGNCFCPGSCEQVNEDEWCSQKKQINGSAVHVTASFGFFLSGLVIQDVVGQQD